MMILRPFNINDAPTILSWCRVKHAFAMPCKKELPRHKAPDGCNSSHNCTIYPIILAVTATIRTFVASIRQTIIRNDDEKNIEDCAVERIGTDNHSWSVDVA